MRDRLLSICIPTYNKSKYLKELIMKVLSSESSVIDVDVQNNFSTDNTYEMLQSIHDERLCVRSPKMKKSPYCYMIECIFNAKGKYAFYCNDRDLIFIEKLPKLLSILENDDYSFIHILPRTNRNTESLKVYNNVFDSLIHQNMTHHPTGMIFNVECIRKHLTLESYDGYESGIYLWDFLMRDLFKYGKTAIFDLGIWDERDPSFKMHHQSGCLNNRNAYFLPSVNCNIMKPALLHALSIENFNHQKVMQIGCYTLKYFTRRLMSYKSCMMSPYETAHYGLEQRRITTIEMLQVFRRCYEDWLEFLCKHDTLQDLADWWRDTYWEHWIRFAGWSIHLDVSYVKHYILKI